MCITVSIFNFVVQLQRNSHADKTCIMNSGQSNTYIRQKTLIATRSIVASCQGCLPSTNLKCTKDEYSSLQPENDPCPSSRRRSTTKCEANGSLTPPSVTGFSRGLHCQCTVPFSGQTAYRARKLSQQFAHSAKPDHVFRLSRIAQQCHSLHHGSPRQSGFDSSQ